MNCDANEEVLGVQKGNLLLLKFDGLSNEESINALLDDETEDTLWETNCFRYL